jgi:hypothetical protein
MFNDDDRPIFSNQPQTIDSAGQIGAWDRRKNETKRAWDAFCLFLHSTDRKLASVAQSLVPPCSVPNVARWSSQHGWQARAWAYDVHQEELQQAQDARDRAAMHRRHLKQAMLLQQIAVAGLLELQAKLDQKLPLDMKPEEVKALMDLGSKLERMTLGAGKHHQYTRINVVMGRHRYPHEPCGCSCTACAGCHGEGKDEDYEGMELEGGDDPKKLN